MLVSIADQYGQNKSLPSGELDAYAYQHTINTSGDQS